MSLKASESLLAEVRACTLCSTAFDHLPRPVLQAHPKARVLIAGQAPGAKVQASGKPFDDASGERLRRWMGIDEKTFRDPQCVAIVPMAFCYPGKGRSGDLPPPAICAATWRRRVLDMLTNIRLTLLIGQYAQQWHLDRKGDNLTQTVAQWQALPESLVALPHPSPRNNIWLKKNPWFEQTLVPILQQRVARALALSGPGS